MGRTADSGIMHTKNIGNFLHRIITGLICFLHIVLQDLAPLPPDESCDIATIISAY